jgi:hypothetical protein
MPIWKRILWTPVLVIIAILKVIALAIISFGWACVTSWRELVADLAEIWTGKRDA